MLLGSSSNLLNLTLGGAEGAYFQDLYLTGRYFNNTKKVKFHNKNNVHFGRKNEKNKAKTENLIKAELVDGIPGVFVSSHFMGLDSSGSPHSALIIGYGFDCQEQTKEGDVRVENLRVENTQDLLDFAATSVNIY